METGFCLDQTEAESCSFMWPKPMVRRLIRSPVSLRILALCTVRGSQNHRIQNDSRWAKNSKALFHECLGNLFGDCGITCWPGMTVIGPELGLIPGLFGGKGRGGVHEFYFHEIADIL